MPTSPSTLIAGSFGSVPSPVGGVHVSTGIPNLISGAFTLIAIAGGLYTTFNVVMAGYQYITSQGDPQKIQSAQQKIYMSIVGMAIISSSFIFAAILGKIFFGNYDYLITNPFGNL